MLVQKYKSHTVKHDIVGKFVTTQGESKVLKGEHVTLLALQEPEGPLYYAIKKQSNRLILFPSEIFGTFNNFQGAL